MDLNELISLLVQVPLVAVFVWFTLEMTKRHSEAEMAMAARFQEEQKRRDEAQERRDLAYVQALGRIADKMEEHDERLGTAIIRMEERTAVPGTHRGASHQEKK
jgi:hypothetical protein